MAKHKRPLVLVEWVDSSQPLSAWHWLHDLKPFSAVKCASVGWLLHDGRKVKALAPNMGDLKTAGQIQASGVIKIAASCVTAIKPLVEIEANGKKKRHG